jgi:hypothetical protein
VVGGQSGKKSSEKRARKEEPGKRARKEEPRRRARKEASGKIRKV